LCKVKIYGHHQHQNFLDEKPISDTYSGNDVVSGKVMTLDDGLYNIVNSEEPASHLLKIDISEPGFEMYTFTFG